MKTRNLLPVLGTLCCVFSSSAHADLKWTEVMTFGDGKTPDEAPEGMPPGMGKMSITTNHWAKKDASRMETVMNMGPIKMNTAEISHCDTKERILLDNDLKMYAPTTPEMAGMGGMPVMPPMGGMPGMAGDPPAGKPGKGTAAIEVSVTDLGKETIAGVETRHYRVKTKTTATGCAGNGTTETEMETWVANIRMPAACQQGDYKTGIAQATRMQPSCDVTTTYKGDEAGMKNAFDGLIMRMKIGGQQGFTKEVTMLSQAELDDSPFTLPADWKKVTEKELQGAQQKAMMKKIMGGMNIGGGEADEDNN